MPYEVYCVNPRESAFDVYQWTNQIRLGYRAAWNAATDDDYVVDILDRLIPADVRIDRSCRPAIAPLLEIPRSPPATLRVAV